MNKWLEGDPLAIGLNGYWEEDGLAMLAGAAATSGAVEHFFDSPCRYRGQLVRIGTCDQCAERGQPFEVLACSVHGECSLSRKNRKVKSCLSCDEFAAPLAPSDPPAVS